MPRIQWLDSKNVPYFKEIRGICLGHTPFNILFISLFHQRSLMIIFTCFLLYLCLTVFFTASHWHLGAFLSFFELFYYNCQSNANFCLFWINSTLPVFSLFLFFICLFEYLIWSLMDLCVILKDICKLIV